MAVDRIGEAISGLDLNGLAPSLARAQLLARAEKITDDDVATIDDLVKAGSEVRWLWPGWIQIGVLTALAAKGGTGKTRFVADLVRRMRHNLGWPDGAPINLPEHGAVALWVVSDNHHDEMVTLTRDFAITDAVRINAPKSDPYAGVSLETDEDLIFLEARVKAVRPVVVVIDTVGNSTDKNMSRQEDAKAYYQPLQILARKCNCAVLCLTHLNAAGQFLGRRVQEKVRVAIRIDHFEEVGDKRRLEVRKSNSMVPPALGLIMGGDGNDYDNEPPEAPEEFVGKAAGPKPPTEAERSAMEWLQGYLRDGPKRVSITRHASELVPMSSKTLYAAVRLLKVHSFRWEGYEWWSLTADEAFG